MGHLRIGFIVISLFLLGVIILQPLSALATDATEDEIPYEFTVIERKDILNDPMAKRILENIEIAKKKLAEMQDIKPILTEHQKFVEEQRRMVQEQLQKELDRINKKYENYTPRAAFAKYVAKQPDYLHGFYWELFNYLEQKVMYAKEQKQIILASGGSRHDARQAFIQYATFPKAEAFAVVEEARVKHGIGGVVAGQMDLLGGYSPEAKALYESWMSDPTMLKTYPERNFVSVTEEGSLQNFMLDSSPRTIEIARDSSEETYTVVHEINPYVTEQIEIQEHQSETAVDLSGEDFVSEGMEEMNTVSEFTVSAWVKPDLQEDSLRHTAISKDRAFVLSINNIQEPKGLVSFSIFDGIKWTTVDSKSLITNKWNHIAATLDGSSISIYVNGELEGQKELAGTFQMNPYGYFELSPMQNVESNSDVIIGAEIIVNYDGVSSKNFFSGMIDEVLVQDKLLDEIQIEELCTNSPYHSIL